MVRNVRAKSILRESANNLQTKIKRARTDFTLHQSKGARFKGPKTDLASQKVLYLGEEVFQICLNLRSKGQKRRPPIEGRSKQAL